MIFDNFVRHLATRHWCTLFPSAETVMVLGGGAGGCRPTVVGSRSALSFWGTMDGSTAFKMTLT